MPQEELKHPQTCPVNGSLTNVEIMKSLVRPTTINTETVLLKLQKRSEKFIVVYRILRGQFMNEPGDCFFLHVAGSRRDHLEL